MIETYQSGYKPLTEPELFGEDYDTYQRILRDMKQLCEQAEQMTSRVGTRNNNKIYLRCENV